MVKFGLKFAPDGKHFMEDPHTFDTPESAVAWAWENGGACIAYGNFAVRVFNKETGTDILEVNPKRVCELTPK